MVDMVDFDYHAKVNLTSTVQINASRELPNVRVPTGNLSFSYFGIFVFTPSKIFFKKYEYCCSNVLGVLVLVRVR